MAYNKKYYNKNKDKHRNSQYKYLYGSKLFDYVRLFKWQNGRCAMCNRVNNYGKHFNIDHNHRTGEIRGLLCDGCNFVLGMVENNQCFVGLKFEQTQNYLAFFVDIEDLEVYNRDYE